MTTGLRIGELAKDCGILNELAQAAHSRILKEPRTGHLRGTHANGRKSR